MRSVRSRVVLLTVAVAVVSVLTTAWLATRNVESSVRDSVSQSLETDVSILQSLTDYAAMNESWDDVDELVLALSETTGRRIALVRDGEVLVDSDELRGSGPSPLPPAASAVIDPLASSSVLYSPLVITSGATVSGGFSVALPIDASAIAVGEVTQVGSSFDPAGTPVEPLPAEGFPVEVAGSTGSVGVVENIEAVEGIESPSGSASVAAMQPAPSAQLYLGRRAEDPLQLNGDGRWRTLLIVGGVVAMAAALAWVLARQLTRPLDRLAVAAHRVRSGDLSGRVDGSSSGEVGEVARAFNSMAESLELSQAQRRQMTSDIAHELRNPLVTINGTLEAIQDGLYQPDAQVIASLVEETEHLRSLVDDLQQLSMAESGGLTLHREQVALGELADQVVTAHGSAATAAGVELRRVGDDPVASVDGRRVRQVLSNLVGNAIRHSPADSTVIVSVAAVDGGVELTVTDTGEGIAPDDVAHVFDRFWRADPSRTRESGGAGLGLAISHELVRLHGGTIEVTSELGEGSTFTVRLPSDAAPG